MPPCTKFDLGLGSDPYPWGNLQRSPDPLAGFQEPTSNGGRGGEGKREGKEEVMKKEM